MIAIIIQISHISYPALASKRNPDSMGHRMRKALTCLPAEVTLRSSFGFGRPLAVQAVRGKSGHHKATRPVKTGDVALARRDGRPVPQKTNRRFLRVPARVKRGGKSSPLPRQRRRHGKPRVVQDKQGKGRLPAESPGNSRTGPVKRPGTLRREKNGRTAPCRGRTESGLQNPNDTFTLFPCSGSFPSKAS